MISKSKILFLITLISIFFLSCNKKLEVPKNSQLFAKHIVFDENVTSKILKSTNVEVVVEEFTKNKESHTVFKFENKIYKSEFNFILYPDGTLHRLYRQCDDEPEIYSKIIDSLNINRKTIGVNFLIKLSKSHTGIIDGKDTLSIEKIYPKEKLILVKQQNNIGRITFYEYTKANFKVEKEIPD
jgi:hypothetical protein